MEEDTHTHRERERGPNQRGPPLPLLGICCTYRSGNCLSALVSEAGGAEEETSSKEGELPTDCLTDSLTHCDGLIRGGGGSRAIVACAAGGRRRYCCPYMVLHLYTYTVEQII